MAHQRGTTSATGGCHDALTNLVAFATSNHASAVVLNAAGTGYTVGDILTITHGSAYHDLVMEVLTITGGGGTGPVGTVVIRDAGAFADRVTGVVINVAGTGYATDEIVRIVDGTFTEFCKVKIDTQAGGVPSAISIFETGGAYTVDPTLTASTTNSDIGEGVGTGLTIDVTMTAIVGSTAIAATGGTGSSVSFDLTLTATGMSCVAAKQNQNNYSVNSITNEKEVILLGTVAGGDAPYIGIRTYTATSGLNTRYGWLLAGMDSYNSSLAFSAQANVGPATTPAIGAIHFLMFDDDQDFWMVADGRHVKMIVKAVGASVTSYVSMFHGLMDPFGTQTESPYPFYISGTTGTQNRPPDVGGNFVTGLTELYCDPITTPAAYFRRASDGAWTAVINSAVGVAQTTSVLFPLGEIVDGTTAGAEDRLGADSRMEIHMGGGVVSGSINNVSQANGGSTEVLIMPTIGDGELLLIPCDVLTAVSGNNDSETKIRGELPGIFWTPGTDASANTIAAEDYIDKDGIRYYIFQNVHRSERYSFFAMRAN